MIYLVWLYCRNCWECYIWFGCIVGMVGEWYIWFGCIVGMAGEWYIWFGCIVGMFREWYLVWLYCRNGWGMSEFCAAAICPRPSASVDSMKKGSVGEVKMIIVVFHFHKCVYPVCKQTLIKGPYFSVFFFFFRRLFSFCKSCKVFNISLRTLNFKRKIFDYFKRISNFCKSFLNFCKKIFIS